MLGEDLARLDDLLSLHDHGLAGQCHNGVEVVGDEYCKKVCNEIGVATEEDWHTEYLDAVLSIKIVDSLDEAIEHINEHNTKHSECIITND